MTYIPRKVIKGKHYAVYKEAKGKVKTKAAVLKEALGIAAAGDEHQKWVDFVPAKFTLQCYDNKTEVLTDLGWKLFKNLGPNSKVATLLTEPGVGKDKELKFEKPEKIWVQDYNKQLYYLENKELSLAVTPEHDLYYLSGGKGRGWRTISVVSLLKEIKLRKRVVLNPGIARWKGTFNSPVFFELLGFWFGDGSYQINGKDGSRNFSITFTQKSKKEYLLNLLRRNGLEDRLRICSREPKGTLSLKIEGQEIAEFFSQFGKKEKKSIPVWIRNADTHSLRAFLEGFTQADGYRRSGDWRLLNASKTIIDQLQEIALKAGYPSILYSKFVKTDFCPRGRTLYILSLKRKRKIAVAKEANWKKKLYQGKIYSVKTRSGIILVRRDGKCCWSGNCHGWFAKDTFKNLKEAVDFIHTSLKAGGDPVKDLEKKKGGKWHYDLRIQKATAPNWFGLTPFRAPWTGTMENKVMGSIKGYQSIAPGGKKLQKFLLEQADKEMAKEGIAERRDRLEWMKIKAQWFPVDSPGNPQKNQEAIMVAIEFFKPAVLHRRELDFVDCTFLGNYLKGRYYNRLVERKVNPDELMEWQRKDIAAGKAKEFYNLSFYFWKAKDQFDPKEMLQIAFGRKTKDRIPAPPSKSEPKAKKIAAPPLATKAFH